MSGACVLREQEAGRGDGRIGQQKNSTRPPHLKQTRPRFPDPPSSCASLLFCKGPHLCLPQLRVPGGRPPFRLVRVPQRNHALRPGAHRVHSRCPRRPDPALHPGRGLPGVRARGGRLLFGAVGGGDDAVLYVHGVRAPVAGLCVRRAGRGGEGRESFFVEREGPPPGGGVLSPTLVSSFLSLPRHTPPSPPTPHTRHVAPARHPPAGPAGGRRGGRRNGRHRHLLRWRAGACFSFFLLIFLAARHAPARCVSVCAWAAPSALLLLPAPAQALPEGFSVVPSRQGRGRVGPYSPNAASQRRGGGAP